MVAGATTKSNKIGFVAAKPIAQVRRNINSFCLGARSVNEKAEVHVIFTGDWNLPTQEANAVGVLVSKGCDVFTCHVDSPKVIVETAAKAGKWVTGYHANQSELAPKLYLTGAEWNWEKVYVDFVTKLKAGEKIPNYTRGGLKEGIIRMSPYGPEADEKGKKAADAAKAEFMKGGFVIFKGPLKDNKGMEVIPAGKKIAQDDPVLEDMNYFVEGVFAAE
jgi:simple sugar transport system substrate-binding protein